MSRTHHGRKTREASIKGRAPLVAREFHRTYEALAPEYGYQTRPESAVSWDSLPAANKALMIATVKELLLKGVIR